MNFNCKTQKRSFLSVLIVCCFLKGVNGNFTTKSIQVVTGVAHTPVHFRFGVDRNKLGTWQLWVNTNFTLNMSHIHDQSLSSKQ